MNFYPFHIGDYKSHTSHLTWDEDMAYRRLLDVYYTAEGPLADDLRKIFRLVCAATESQRTAVETVLHEFFVLTDGGWINTRADAELSVMQSKRMKAKASAAMRWDSDRNANAMRTHTKVDANAYETLCEGNATNTNTNTKKEQKQKKTTRAASASLSSSALVADGLSEQEASDYLAHRKAKRAPLTQTAWDGIKAEAHKAKLSASAVAVLCTQRGWVGFDAAWMTSSKTSERARVIRDFSGNPYDTERTVDVDAHIIA
jgi:uncharacterized protein YdaU (DUF1376 family)